ncbi:DMT family transporter [Leptolyngbya sp. 7M]|uniref:DMT family transporter n=1 Tax=Leptolyngbya sp. 7M TaxID=2812896 RepID=UPI001B8D4F36|nr:EamA family transporter [Leptolyngbya sp. 7M]QYO66986.1 EamA family transporter [Leptolyngbya sp. 7M]
MKVFVWLLLCVIWGTTWIFIKIGLDDLPPITFASARFVLAVAILLPIIYFQRLPWPNSITEWRLIALTGILQFSVNYSTVFWAEQYITSGLAAVLQAMITVFGLGLAWIFLPNERITKQKIAAVLIGIAGVAVIFYDQLRVESILAFAGSVAIVAGSFAAAQASILVKAKGGGIHPASLLTGQMLCGLPILLTYVFIAEGGPLVHNWSARAVFSVLYLTIAGTIAAFWLYYWLLARIESTKAMMISLVTPLIAVLVGNIFLGETMPPHTIFGGVLILTAIALIVLRKRVSPIVLNEEAGEKKVA